MPQVYVSQVGSEHQVLISRNGYVIGFFRARDKQHAEKIAADLRSGVTSYLSLDTGKAEAMVETQLLP